MVAETMFNYPVQSPSQAGNPWVTNSDQFRFQLLSVGISDGTAKEIDQFFFNELSLANFNNIDREYILKMFKSLRMYLYASTTNLKSKRKYSLVPNILRCYERARTVAVTTKGLDGWGIQQVLHPKVTQITQEKLIQEQYTQKKKEGWLSQNKEGQNA